MEQVSSHQREKYDNEEHKNKGGQYSNYQIRLFLFLLGDILQVIW